MTKNYDMCSCKDCAYSSDIDGLKMLLRNNRVEKATAVYKEMQIIYPNKTLRPLEEMIKDYAPRQV